MNEEKENWYGEQQTNGVKLLFKMKKKVYEGRSEYQHLEIYESREFGKIMFLDGTVQLTERDEFIYHEMITHVPLNYHRAPKRVLVIGGGDGGTVREILKHRVDSITLVEIDKIVVDSSKKYFPSLAKSLDDRKVEVIIDDGIKYVENSKSKYDIVIIDSTDPVGPAKALFSDSFYRNVRSKLNKNGIVVTQSGSPFYYPEHLKIAVKNMRKSFAYTYTYLADIPTYPSSIWSFTIATDSKLEKVYRRKMDTKYYTYELHKNLALPSFVQNIVNSI
ncbi:MAG: polyamine aminopropyltransferase [Thermoplasmata archaeon]